MQGISIGGLGSGIDVDGLVSKLIAAEGQPAANRFLRREANLQQSLSAVGTVKGALSELQATVAGLADASSMRSLAVTVDDDSLLAARVQDNAVPGLYSVEVQQTATGQKLASDPFTDLTEAVGSGTLTIRFGRYDADSNSFIANPERETKTLTIDSASNSLIEIRDAINAAELGVSANIVNDGSGYRLALGSTQTGMDNGLQIEVSDDDGNDVDATGLSRLSYVPSATEGNGRNMSEKVAARDAIAVIDGLEVRSAQNTLSSALVGVELDLRKADPGVITEVTVAQNTTEISRAVEGFVSSYNKLTGTLIGLTAYDAETGRAGPLLGDAGVRTIGMQLRRMVGDLVTGGSASVRSLADIGVTTQRDGSLSLDSQKLRDAIEADPSAVIALLARDGRTTDSNVRFLSSTSASVPGAYNVVVDQLATQGAYVGSTVSSLTVDDDNDTFALKVDGVQSGTVTIGQGSYTNGDDLAAELQSRINGDSALDEGNVSVTVSYDSSNNRFEFRSSSYGESSRVEITAVDNTSSVLGVALGAGVAGVDVKGRIGGLDAAGSGRTLTGAGQASGIALSIEAGAIGNRGSVSLSDGLGARLASYVDSLLTSDGTMQARIESLNSRIEDIGEQRATLDGRLASLEKRLYTQFSAMDRIVSDLSATSDFLTQQLAVLNFNQRD